MNGIESPALAVWKCIPYALYFARELPQRGGNLTGKPWNFQGVCWGKAQFQHFVLLQHSSSICHANVRRLDPRRSGYARRSKE